MEWQNVIALIGALGGFEFIKWLSNRRTEKKKTTQEIKHSREEWLEKRLSERDAKVDAIYKELRDTQLRELGHLETINKLEFEVMLRELQKCEKRACKDREPPGAY